jgi:acetylserotonin O-methyltransferase
MSHSDPSLVLDYIEAFRRSKAMFTAVRLGVFDRLAHEPQTAKQLAETLGLHGDSLERLLNACVALELLKRNECAYANTKLAARYLVSTSPDTLAGYIVYSDQSLYELWSHLGDAVREGSNRWTQVFGGKNALFDHYFRDEAATASFLGGMHGIGQITSAKVVRAFDLSRFHHLVDLGGATGHLAIAACEAYPNLGATVLDLKSVVPFARKHVEKSEAAARIDIVEGDFFSDPLPSADLYSLGRILHDWGNDRIQPLLKKIFEALPPEGGLLVGEKLLKEDRSGPRAALMQDLNMLVCTDGRERSASEYEALLRDAGFRKVSAVLTGTPLDAVLAIKEFD